MKCQLCQVFVRILEDVKEKENKIMARKDYDQFADELIAAVGGKENIVSVTKLHDPSALCAGRREHRQG